MKVKATRLGYCGHKRRKIGEVFEIEDAQFSAKWMEKVDSKKSKAKPSKVEAEEPDAQDEVI